MAKQIANRDFARRGNRILLAAIRGLHQYLGILEFRQIFGDGILKQEVPLLIQNHHRRRGDRLGHRADPKNRIRLHGFARFAILHALRLEIRNLPVTKHQCRPRPRCALSSMSFCTVLLILRSALRRKPDRLRLGARKFLRCGGSGKNDAHKTAKGRIFD